MKKIALKITALFCIISFIIPYPTQAVSISIDPVGMMNRILSDLGVNKPELKNAIQTFNVSRTKKDAPTVNISFLPAHPIAGEIVTAVAQPNNFLNDSSQLYYTWYIKHADDNSKNYAAWKKEATRIMARGGFESSVADYDNRGADDSNSKSGYKAFYGGEGSFSQANQKCFLHDFVSGDEYPITCEHLFPDAPGNQTGDGEFTMSEEEYWQTDPNERDTLGSGHPDEANVAGLGAYQFSWVYQTGDKIMVAVEGTSIEPTQDSDASYKVMWALPKNKCGGLSLNPQSTTGAASSETETTINPVTLVKTVVITETLPAGNWNRIDFTKTTSPTVITTTRTYDPDCLTNGTCTTSNVAYSDIPSSETVTSSNATTTSNVINESLEKCSEFDENLVDPVSEGSTQKLDVSLIYGPQNPINNIANPDRLIISSTVLGSDDANGLTYSWHVSKADSADDVSDGKWTALSDRNIPELGNSDGVGLNDLKFNLALSGNEDSKFYLKIKVDVSKKLSDDSSQEGTAYVIIPVVSTNKKINIYSTAIAANGKLQNKASGKRCDAGMEGVLCPVVKNEIIGMEVPDLSGYENYSWSIDGKKITPAEYGDYPGGKIVAYYPVLSELGKQFIISFSATDQDNGQALTLSKTFEVVEPKVNIVCAPNSNNCNPNLLGYYLKLDGSTEADFSTENFSTMQGAMALFTIDKNMPFDKNFQWYVDSSIITDDSAENVFGAYVDAATGMLNLPINKSLNSSYVISYSSDYYQDRDIMKILNQYHGVQFNEFYEKKLGDSIDVKVAYASTISSNETTHKSLASLVLNTSGYLNFLFRIVLTVGLFLFVTKAVMLLLPTRENY